MDHGFLIWKLDDLNAFSCSLRVCFEVELLLLLFMFFIRGDFVRNRSEWGQALLFRDFIDFCYLEEEEEIPGQMKSYPWRKFAVAEMYGFRYRQRLVEISVSSLSLTYME